jgi:diguanylate cyclase (GGDEF)-like protein
LTTGNGADERHDILVVDDTPANLSLLSGMLKEKGYKVRPVPSGKLALMAAASDPPDLVLLDINMPEMDGFEVCRRLKADERLKDIPVIFVSALSEVLDKVEAFRAGGVDYIQKPFQIEEVDARVTTHLKIRDLQMEREKRIETLTFFDLQTGLPNRAFFMNHIGSLLDRPDAPIRNYALVLVEIDQLKDALFRLGEPRGEMLLKAIVETVKENTRFGDLIGRLGFDEFGILFTNIARDADIDQVILDKLFRALSRPFVIDGEEVRVTASAGVAIFPTDGEEPAVLLENASTALAKAKRDGGNGYLFFSEEIKKSFSSVIALENRLRKALDRDEFVLYYQPIVNIRSGIVTGMEALVRWNCPGEGLVPPMKFIPILEQTGMIVDVGRWILETALGQTAKWVADGFPDLRVTVNVSAVQLDRPDFVETTRDAIARSGLRPANVGLEITESLMIDNVKEKVRKLEELRALQGLNVLLDDFGTGYSSLSYLRQLPLDVIKIDRSFVPSIVSDPDSLSILTAIVTLAHSLDMSLVAEGVETAEQLHILKLIKCDKAQGYLLSRPVPADEFGRLLRAGL